MQPIFYVRVFGSRNAALQQAAERAFIERAQVMGYAPTVFDGYDPATSEWLHVSTARAESSVLCGADESAIRREKTKNPAPFAERAENVARIAEVLASLRDQFPGLIVTINQEAMIDV